MLDEIMYIIEIHNSESPGQEETSNECIVHDAKICYH